MTPKITHQQFAVLSAIEAGTCTAVALQQQLGRQGPRFYQLMQRTQRKGWVKIISRQFPVAGGEVARTCYELCEDGRRELTRARDFYAGRPSADNSGVWVVESIDGEEGRHFVDVVPAADADEAGNMVDDVRGSYASVIGATPLGEWVSGWQETIDNLRQFDAESARRDFESFASQQALENVAPELEHVQ